MTQKEKQVLIDAKFNQVFGSFIMPFKSINERLSLMDEVARAKYYEHAKSLNENPVIWEELKDAERIIYQTFPLLENNQTIEFQAMKLLLIFLRERLPARIHDLANHARPVELPTSLELIKKL